MTSLKKVRITERTALPEPEIQTAGDDGIFSAY
jgi:hypothetical protein